MNNEEIQKLSERQDALLDQLSKTVSEADYIKIMELLENEVTLTKETEV